MTFTIKCERCGKVVEDQAAVDAVRDQFYTARPLMWTVDAYDPKRPSYVHACADGGKGFVRHVGYEPEPVVVKEANRG